MRHGVAEGLQLFVRHCEFSGALPHALLQDHIECAHLILRPFALSRLLCQFDRLPLHTAE
jgi:hypothetical protein